VRPGLKGETGAPGGKGERGEQGPSGENGTNGTTNIVVRFTQVTTESGYGGEGVAHCASGERASGGGVALMSGGSPEHIYYYNSGGVPFPETYGATPTGWRARWFNGSGLTSGFRVYVVCSSA
jgi:hypothetical protein